LAADQDKLFWGEPSEHGKHS